MNKDKVYLKGYVIGRAADTLGYQGLMVQLENLDVVEIDKNLVHKGINEPQKVTVPQFVADWYEEHKGDLEYNIWEWFVHGHKKSLIGYKRKFFAWLNSASGNPVQTLVNMHQFGYEVEKEKRYTVKMNVINKPSYLNHDIVKKEWFFSIKHNGLTVLTHHTRKELEEAGLSDVFNSPLFEVEEVE